MNPLVPTSPRHSTSDWGPTLTRLDFDAAGAQQVMWLRLAAAIAAGGSSLWLATVASHWIHGLFALAAGAASLAWLLAFRRAQAATQAQREWYLLVQAGGLQQVHGDQLQQIAWSEVESIDIDEERLVLVLQRSVGGELMLDPIYRSGGLDGLCTTLRKAAGLRAESPPQRSGPEATARPVAPERL